ncbi:MAG: hypothetical protein HY513_05720 [Candidatus Aenigmarchaeota archaeon]|nr:hypothetical protein [Candidatus Aenigmarchaeota archaeon]
MKINPCIGLFMYLLPTKKKLRSNCKASTKNSARCTGALQLQAMSNPEKLGKRLQNVS